MLNLQNFGIPQFTLPIWGVSVIFAYTLVLVLSLERATRKGIPTSDIFKLANMTILGGIIGGRILYLFTQQSIIDLQTIFSWGEVFYAGNLNVMGGYLGGFIIAVIYIQSFAIIYRAKMSWLRFFDNFLYIIPIGMMFGYIGIFFSSVEKGAVSDIAYPWLIQFGDNMVHPWALYVAFGYLILFVLLSLFNNIFYQFRRPGYLTVAFILGISIIHFITDFWHIYNLEIDILKFGDLSITQVITIIMALVTSIIALLRINFSKSQTQ